MWFTRIVLIVALPVSLGLGSLASGQCANDCGGLHTVFVAACLNTWTPAQADVTAFPTDLNDGAEHGPSPNIVLILADDAGYNELGYTGINPFVTPNIDALAQSGIRFTHGYVTSPICGPSRAGLLTGVYQQRYGFEHLPTKNWAGLPAGQATLTQHLQDLGYTTGVIGKWNVGFNVGVNSPPR